MHVDTIEAQLPIWTDEHQNNPAGNKFKTLTAIDRCDSCPAAAVAQFLVGDTVLHSCGHHWRKIMDTVREKGYPVQVDANHDYKFTNREIAKRPADNKPRDAGAAPLN